MKLQQTIKQSKPFRNVYHQTTVNLLFTGRWIFNLHNELFKTFGLTMQQYNILRILKGQNHKPSTIKLIRERMLDKMSDTSRIVEGLRKKGYLIRELNANNRRQVDILITQKGLDILNRIEEEGSETMDNFLSRLNLVETEQLNILLDKLRD